jgi:hypothetical protein
LVLVVVSHGGTEGTERRVVLFSVYSVSP